MLVNTFTPCDDGAAVGCGERKTHEWSSITVAGIRARPPPRREAEVLRSNKFTKRFRAVFTAKAASLHASKRRTDEGAPRAVVDKDHAHFQSLSQCTRSKFVGGADSRRQSVGGAV